MNNQMVNQNAHKKPDNVTLVNVAATCSATSSLGPGLRAVVWVQGCALRCPGCVAPDWIPIRPAHLVSPEQLVEEVLIHPEITGLTISGGEPMLQAGPLAKFLYYARKIRKLNVICFTGFHLADLETNPPGPGIEEFLDQLDVLIDGPYIARLNDNRGLRGSSNQRIHYLTDTLKGVQLDRSIRHAEIQVRDGQAMLVGVPPVRMGEAFHNAVDMANQRNWELLRSGQAGVV